MITAVNDEAEFQKKAKYIYETFQVNDPFSDVLDFLHM